VLSELLLGHATDRAMLVEDDAARTGGALIQGEDVLGRHAQAPWRSAPRANRATIT
jgi:hypothetical protein